VTAEGFRVLDVRGDSLARIGDQWTRVWARIEEIVVKRLGHGYRPWLELYGVKRN
jgi:hypothetical protein